MLRPSGCAPGLPRAPASPGAGLALAWAWPGARLGWLGVLRSQAAAGVVWFARPGTGYSAVWRGSSQVQAGHRSGESKGTSPE